MKLIRSLAVLLVLTLISKTFGQRPPAIRPIAFSLPPPPSLTGALASNDFLTNAEKVAENKIRAPSSFVNHKGHLYSTSSDNKIFDMASCPPRLVVNLLPPGCSSSFSCGHVSSIRRYPGSDSLLALDSYRGLFMVHPQNGTFKLIYSSKTPVNGRRPVFLNDMVVTSDGVIMMTDSSNVYTLEHDVYICMDGRPTGRILALRPRNGLVSELPGVHFNFPNGLELAPNGDLLVTETCRAAVYRVSLNRQSWLRVTPFSRNLPGLPDNIRLTDRGTYWVAMTYARHAGITNPIDQYAENPRYREMGFRRMTQQVIRDMFSKWGIIVELDGMGRILTTLHDPTGSTLSTATEVNEYGGVLNIGSRMANYMTRIIKPTISASKSSIESLIQVKKSRCQLTDSQAEEIQKKLSAINATTTATPAVSTATSSAKP